MNKLICVVGGGAWGCNHIKTLDHLGCLGSVVDPDISKLKSLNKKYPYIKTYTNINDAINSKKYQGYIVATPAETHYEIAKNIINQSLHVLVEKPLCLNINQAEHLVMLAKINNVNLMVGHLLLFHPAIIKVKELIDNGAIGKLQYIYSNRLNFGKVRTSENVFWSLAPHDISIFQYFTDSYPLSIDVFGSAYIQNGIYDSTITQLKYSNGIDGHIFVSWLHPFKEHRLVFIGSKAMITFDDSSENKPLKFYSKKIDMARAVPEKIDGPVENIKYEQKLPLTEELLYFIKHLDGTMLKKANAQDALDITKILVETGNKLEMKL